MKHKKSRRKTFFVYKGKDDDLELLSAIDPVAQLTFAEKAALITHLTTFHYQLQNNTTDVPRFLRTTALIRKP
jgi:hypothetical protein